LSQIDSRFLTYVSQGSVATRLRCGGMCKEVSYITRLLLSLTVKEF